MSEIDDFLAAYPDEIQGLAQSARRFLQAACPDCDEVLHAGWKAISYSPTGASKRVCAIIPHKAWINLQFHSGASLDDPTRRLEGTGKSMRHVKIRASSDLDDEVRDLVAQAVSLAG